MTIHKHLNQQLASREIAVRSRFQRGYNTNLTEREVNRVLGLFFDVVEESLTTPGGKVSFSRLGIIKACPRSVGGALRQGSGAAEAIQHQTYTLQFRPSKQLKTTLKQNAEQIKPKPLYRYPRGIE